MKYNKKVNDGYYDKKSGVCVKEIKNHEGAKAWELLPEVELYTTICTSALSGDNFYESGNDRIKRIKELFLQVKPEFIAKLAYYVREHMYLRSIPMFMLAELARIHNGDSLVKKAVSLTVQRVDEIMELLSCYNLGNQDRKIVYDKDGLPCHVCNKIDKKTKIKCKNLISLKKEDIIYHISNHDIITKGKCNKCGQPFDLSKLTNLSVQLRKGLSQVFNKFDEYQFAKYNRDGIIKLKDAMFLVHPIAKNEKQDELFKKIANDTLTVPYTWEVELSKAGQEKKDKKIVWEELIDSGKVGYMALLRNLRNFLENEVSSKHIEKVLAILSDKDEVLKSKQFPFRFLSAWREIKKLDHKYVPYVLESLNQAILHSIHNIKQFSLDESIMIACDVSGSMQWDKLFRPGVKKKGNNPSTIFPYDIGLVLGMLIKSKCKNSVSGIFGNTFEVVQLPISNVLGNVDQLYSIEGKVGYSTNGYTVLKWALDNNKEFSKIFIFTDCQLWNSNGSSEDNHINDYWNEYRSKYPNSKLYIFDLVGYGHSPLKLVGNNVYVIAGWSDRIFEMVENIEKGKDVIEMINNIVL